MMMTLTTTLRVDSMNNNNNKMKILIIIITKWSMVAQEEASPFSCPRPSPVDTSSWTWMLNTIATPAKHSKSNSKREINNEIATTAKFPIPHPSLIPLLLKLNLILK